MIWFSFFGAKIYYFLSALFWRMWFTSVSYTITQIDQIFGSIVYRAIVENKQTGEIIFILTGPIDIGYKTERPQKRRHQEVSKKSARSKDSFCFSFTKWEADTILNSCLLLTFLLHMGESYQCVENSKNVVHFHG